MLCFDISRLGKFDLVAPKNRCSLELNHSLPMPSIRLPRIVRPGVLSNLKPSSIHRLLQPFDAYFQSRMVDLSTITTKESTLQEIVAVIASPIESTPPELVEQLELLDLISDPQSSISFEDGYEKIVAHLLEPDDSSEDLAVKILIHAPEIAWRIFDRQALHAKRALISFTHNPRLPMLTVTPERLNQLENHLRPWFEKNARSSICRVHVREEPSGVSFVIRHGDLLKRISVFDEDGSATSKILRPERVDVAHYRSHSREWQISGIGRRLQELYQQAFGAAFHGSPHALVLSHCYSLAPLLEGPSCLKCNTNAKVQFAQLTSLTIELPTGQRLVINSGDVFEGLKAINAVALQNSTMIEAHLLLKIEAKRRKVPVVIRPDKDKISGSHLDDAIERWLIDKGFFQQRHEESILESA